MKKIVILLLASIFLFGCNKTEKTKTYQDIMAEKEFIIIDVRTKEEYESEHIKEAINIPVDQIDDSIQLEKDKNIFVYCRSGARSKKAYNILKELGYSVYDLGAYDSISLSKEKE